jgi:hypothetical protein
MCTCGIHEMLCGHILAMLANDLVLAAWLANLVVHRITANTGYMLNARYDSLVKTFE